MNTKFLPKIVKIYLRLFKKENAKQIFIIIIRKKYIMVWFFSTKGLKDSEKLKWSKEPKVINILGFT